MEETKKKSKKGLIITLIIVGSVLFMGLTTLLSILFINIFKNKPVINPITESKITITFDSDGGLEVEKITFDKGTTVELPETTKEGFTFSGWFNEDKQYKTEDTSSLEKDITLKAKWETVADGEYMTIYFDSKGGKMPGNNSNDSQSLVPCKNGTYTIDGLPTPTKEGYNFLSWADKNGTPILNGALLTCNKELYLYANWEKASNTNQNTEKKYKCPSGYYLDGTKCKMTGTVKSKCPSNTKVDGDLCINTSVSNAGTRKCKEYTVSTDGKGHTYTGDGDYYMVGNSYGKCAYYKWGYTTKSACESANDIYHRTVWVSELNGCYAETVMNNYETVCASDYKYYSSSELSSKFGIYDNGKCLKKVTKELYCDYGYTLTAGSCIKTIDATLE